METEVVYADSVQLSSFVGNYSDGFDAVTIEAFEGELAVRYGAIVDTMPADIVGVDDFAVTIPAAKVPRFAAALDEARANEVVALELGNGWHTGECVHVHNESHCIATIPLN